MNPSLSRSQIILLLMLGFAMIGCAAASSQNLAQLPDRRKVTRESLVFHTNFYFPRRHRLVEELLSRRADVESILGLVPSDETIHVFLFEDQEKFRNYLRAKHPTFPDRRAFFLQSSTNLMVYAHWNTRVAEDLRHEVTHAYLHSVIPEIPLWLDEGIAEYFEVPTSQRGINQAHLEYLTNEHAVGRWQPDLERLESLREAGEMSQLDYAESWLWIHYLIHHDEKTVGLLQSFLQQWQYDQLSNRELSLSPQLERLDSDSSIGLVEHLESLKDSKQFASTHVID